MRFKINLIGKETTVSTVHAIYLLLAKFYAFEF